MSTIRHAKKLVKDVTIRYLPYMEDEEIRAAVIIKCIALVGLAYGIPPKPGEPLDTDELLDRLLYAEDVLAKKTPLGKRLI